MGRTGFFSVSIKLGSELCLRSSEYPKARADDRDKNLHGSVGGIQPFGALTDLVSGANVNVGSEGESNTKPKGTKIWKYLGDGRVS